MKIEKNKIVFSAVLACILLFLAGYTMLILSEDEAPTIQNNQIPLPKLEEGQKEYNSKLDALNDLKEVRETNAPSIYNERLLDSTGVYDPDLLDKEKMRLVDSIYNEGRISYSYGNSSDSIFQTEPVQIKRDSIVEIFKEDIEIVVKELELAHQLFFASNPLNNDDPKQEQTDSIIYVQVDGTQTVQTNYRLRMRLTEPAKIDNKMFPINTSVYGFVTFKPNRTIINIENINHLPVQLKAFDLQDGSEGVYIENSFRDEARQEVIGDVVDDINIAGVPQVNGVKRIFQRNNKNVKVTITDNYKLVLKPNNHK
ncbi:uncharacterized protein DUF3714 [Jejuia pallidilutea]|uniref:Uncharacterized protein DUF3714 n=1 Tax=Jejuia pallidilutea TaxID=504487 RepID=A0A362X9X9_9FLAO|nr:conjugative transposon protein TraM [Jejuia pallidilutea]PQV48831.1 uncharacterized protein DUF3714 [Jejuia pallidilutea]